MRSNNPANAEKHKAHEEGDNETGEMTSLVRVLFMTFDDT